MPITEVTRLAIQDCLEPRPTKWWGRLTQPEFLARLYDLDSLPSTDGRYQTANGDICCHTVSWPDDWEWDWIFSDKRFELAWEDEKFVSFLAQILHPRVCPETDDAIALHGQFNSALAPDGWCLVQVDTISERPVFAASRTGHLNPIVPVDALSTPHVHRQIQRMQASIDSDPDLAIGSAKELLETTCKTIFGRLQIEVEAEVPGLVKSTLKGLGLDLSGAESVSGAEKAMRRLLGNLSGVGAAIGEVRNAIGTGHGRHASAEHAAPMYARLTVNATAALVTFIIERHQSLSSETLEQAVQEAE